MMVAAVSGSASRMESENSKITAAEDGISRQRSLLPSEKDNNNGVSDIRRKPKTKVVSSRYMVLSSSSTSSASTSDSSSRRFPSPLISRNTPNSADSGLKRSASVDRYRPAAKPLAPGLDYKNRGANDMSAATKLLVTSTRSLSVSFQGETFSLPVSKTKVAPSSPVLRKGTPERRRTTTPSRGKPEGVGDRVDNFKLADQHRWPARNQLVNPMSKNLSDEKVKLTDGSGDGVPGLIDERISSFDRRSSFDLDSSDLLKEFTRRRNVKNSAVNELTASCDCTASDSDSVSSGSTTGIQESGSRTSNALNGSRGNVFSARFWHETNSRMKKLQDPSSPLFSGPGSKVIIPPNMKRLSVDGSFPSPRTMLSPSRVFNRSASPSKVAPIGSSPSRSKSPSWIRNAVSTICNNFLETPSVLSFAVDIRRGKVGENRIADAHLLRLLYNRHLQWRLVNATTDTVLLVQKHIAEKNLWDAWISISDLRDTVTKKRHKLQLVRQKLRLASILKQEMTFVEDWASMEKDHFVFLTGAIESLKASTLRLPVVERASADIISLKDAINSAVEFMQATLSSIDWLLPIVEELTCLVTELAKLTNQERASLEQCTDMLSVLTAMQVQGCSLRTQLLQYNRPSSAM